MFSGVRYAKSPIPTIIAKNLGSFPPLLIIAFLDP